MIRDTINAKGSIVITVYDEDMRIVNERHYPNLVVALGKKFIAERIVRNTPPPISHIAIGNGSTVATNEDISLEIESQNGRVAINSISVVGGSVSFSSVFGPGYGIGNISEAGLFNSNSNGVMMCRTTFPAVMKTDRNTIAISWTVVIS